MTYENIKSIILTILVVLSGVFTWSLWTYQPNYDYMKNANMVEEEPIGAKRDIDKIVRPDKIFYHHENEQHFATVDAGEIERTVKEISLWNFDEFENISADIKQAGLFMHEKGNVVLTFPDLVPINLYKRVIQISDKNVENFEFDRIVINLEDIKREDGLVYFISSKENKVYRSYVRASFVQSFKNKYFQNSVYNENFAEYMRYESGGNLIFLPMKEQKMVKYQYLSSPLEPEKFKNALFKDPSLVQKTNQPSMEEYTDSLSLLRVIYSTNMIVYINLAGTDGTITEGDLLKKSIDFINDHGGWTDHFRYSNIDRRNQTILFRQYVPKGYPIFSDNLQISQIELAWGKNEISSYERSNFSLGSSLMETEEITLIPGQQVVNHLESLEGFDADLLEDIKLGYKMTKDSQTKLIHLDPSWYYKYNDEWKSFHMDEIGGIGHGLE